MYYATQMNGLTFRAMATPRPSDSWRRRPQPRHEPPPCDTMTMPGQPCPAAGLGCCGKCGTGLRGLGAAGDQYNETSWGMVALGATGGILVGMFFSWAWFSQKKGYKANYEDPYAQITRKVGTQHLRTQVRKAKAAERIRVRAERAEHRAKRRHGGHLRFRRARPARVW